MSNVTKKKLGIVTDSTCDMPEELLKKYNIRTVPLKVIFGQNEVRHQNRDITNQEFYQRLIAGEMPTTSAPAPKEFVVAVEEALKEYEEIILITVGSKVSATYSVAEMVVKQFFDERVTLIDSNTLSITSSLIVLPAARMAEAGASKEEILTFINKTIPHTQVFGGAATLKYLHKGGRLSKASYYIGSFLHLTPLISVEEGKVISPGKVRGLEVVVEKMKLMADKLVDNRLSELVIIGHCANQEKADEIADHLQKNPNAPKEIVVWEIGPVIGTHLGPGTLGIVWVGDYNEDWFKTKRDLRFWKKEKSKEEKESTD